MAARRVALSVVACLAATGCSPSDNVAEVSGTLRVNGRPGRRVFIQFIPDGAKATQGPISTAETDAAGRFTLQLHPAGGAEVRPGAVVGWHRVVLTDLRLAESATGHGVPVRFPADYTLPGSTPLTQQVKPGKQSINIEIP
jgi:hypothetical protein